MYLLNSENISVKKDDEGVGEFWDVGKILKRFVGRKCNMFAICHCDFFIFYPFRFAQLKVRSFSDEICFLKDELLGVSAKALEIYGEKTVSEKLEASLRDAWAVVGGRSKRWWRNGLLTDYSPWVRRMKRARV